MITIPKEALTAVTAHDEIFRSRESVEKVADAVLEHWRQTSTGRCMCGELISKDPQLIAKHLAYAAIEALLGGVE